ncbi:MAG: glycosyltransferase family 9 protein [Nitrospinae bacterium]|nr:glycosyltransferase family 9 protein [Nitrospinota bacterium]
MDNTIKYKLDCRYFNGEKPCIYKRTCNDCPEYSPMGFRILIIKLGAMGDVLRTTSILPHLKKRYPDSHITWVVETASLPLIRNNPLIDKILVHDETIQMQLQAEKFDLLISLEKIPKGTALAELVDAQQKEGFGLSQYGTPYPYSPRSEYAFKLGISDELKFKINQKTYQQIIFEILDFEYKEKEYLLKTSPEKDKVMKKKLLDIGLDLSKPIIGIAPGSGAVFANKNWNVPKYISLVNKLSKNHSLQVVLLGGKSDQAICDAISKNLEVDHLYDTGRDNSLEDYISLLKYIDLVVSGDTLPMHIALANGKKVVTLFGPTCHQEIEMFERGRAIVSNIECAPCYKGKCDIHPNCMDLIQIDEVYDAVMGLIHA